MIQITVNGDQKSVNDSISLHQLLEDIKINSTRGIAVAVNNEVISRNNWKSHSIQSSDKVTIIKAIQGG